jgi:hypothetical protein
MMHPCVFIYSTSKKVTQQLNVDNFMSMDTPCDCAGSPFLNEHHGHIITGNGEAIDDPEIRAIFNRGTKFRVPKRYDLNNAMKSARKGIDNYIEKVSEKEKIDVSRFDQWRRYMNHFLEERIRFLKNRGTQPEHTDIIFEGGQRRALNDIQKKFVIASVDKASQNYILICKKFYLMQICRILGIAGANAVTDVYEKYDVAHDVIIDRLKNESIAFGVEPSTFGEELPYIRLTPKCHKTPTDFRTIIASKVAITKCVSHTVSLALSLVLKRLRQHCNISRRYRNGINAFWIINDNKPILDALKRINKGRQAKSITTYDFTTLYTTFEHGAIIEAMDNAIDLFKK